MVRPVTLVSGQYGDIPLEQLCALVADIGYDGIEAACWAHVDVDRVMTEDGYAESFLGSLEAHGLRLWAISSHLVGQCVGDQWDPRLDNFAPAAMAGRPEEIRQWVVRRMATVARAAHRLGIDVVTGFLGSPIWPY